MNTFNFDIFRDREPFTEFMLPHALRVLSALLIFYVGRWLVRLLIGILTRGMRRAQADETLIKFLDNVLLAVGLTVVIFSALGQIGVATTSAAAILGGAALAIGLALQGQLSSFAAGTLLILFRPVRVGEWVEAGGKAGTVTEVNIFSTVLTTFGNQQVTLPNSAVWGGNIVNFSRNGWQRLDLTISVGYQSDLLKAKSIVVDLLNADKRVLKEPPPSVDVKALGPNSVDFAVRACATNADAWGLQTSLLEGIKLGFDAAGIAIPTATNQITVNLDKGAISPDASGTAQPRPSGTPGSSPSSQAG